MSSKKELESLKDKITELEKLEYTNQDVLTWENNVLSLLEKVFGKTSEEYTRFEEEIKRGLWHPNSGDTRKIDVTLAYRTEYKASLQKYREILEDTLKRFSEDTGEVKKDGKTGSSILEPKIVVEIKLCTKSTEIADALDKINQLAKYAKEQEFLIEGIEIGSKPM